MIDQDAPQPLYLQIRKVLHHQIRPGQYWPRSCVPSKRELAVQHGESRTTARMSIDVLVVQGLLFRGLGKGDLVTADVLSYRPSTTRRSSPTMCARGQTVKAHVLRQGTIPELPKVTEVPHLSPASVDNGL